VQQIYNVQCALGYLVGHAQLQTFTGTRGISLTDQIFATPAARDRPKSTVMTQ